MKTERTKSGIYFRKGRFGSTAFSPYTGCFFALDPQYDASVKKWLNWQDEQVPSEIASGLGAGWLKGYKSSARPRHHILPNDGWGFMNTIDQPLLINWLITGTCAYQCPYCYAEDLMNGKCREPEEIDIKRIAKVILSYNPLAVVLTGGDPLLSPHLKYAIKLLHKKTGVIVDTSGFKMDLDHLNVFRNHQVFVRISLDSELSKKNKKLRPMKKSLNADTGDIALQAISSCLSNNINLGVQTVATSLNYGELESFGNKLQKIGVQNWRIMLIAYTPQTHDVFRELTFSQKNETRFRNNILPSLRALQRLSSGAGLSIHMAENDVPNAVVLVSPDGIFYTESPDGSGKRPIDPANTTWPETSSFKDCIDMHAHARRYLFE